MSPGESGRTNKTTVNERLEKMSTYSESKIGQSQVGDTGTPGDLYDVIFIGIAKLDDETYEARAAWRRGSNQGYLVDHHCERGRNRGDTIEDALGGLLDDVLDWDSGHAPGLIRSAFKDCQYDAEDEDR